MRENTSTNGAPWWILGGLGVLALAAALLMTMDKRDDTEVFEVPFMEEHPERYQRLDFGGDCAGSYFDNVESYYIVPHTDCCPSSPGIHCFAGD